MNEIKPSTDSLTLEQSVDNISAFRLPPSALKILLWDIDGTLLISPRTGAYKDYFAPALERVYGSSGDLRKGSKVSGMTDLQIAAEALQPAGVTIETIYGKKDEFCRVLGEEIERVCAAEENRFIPLPGTREILAATARHPQFINSLLTGNLPLAAEFKLKFVGLNEFFDFSIGAFGDESHRREDLPAVAARHIRAKFDFDFAPPQFIIIGDTPNDIHCARHFGAKAVAVATGRNHPSEELLPHQPDFLFENLTNTTEILNALEKL